MRALVLAMGLAVAGCGAQPVPYHSGNEIPPGPGLLSGEKGEFVVRAADLQPAKRPDIDE